MKLRNKQTGEIINAVMTGENEIEFQERGGLDRYTYSSLAELNDEWEDYKEPMYYFIADTGGIKHEPDRNDDADKFSKRIGNYFNTWEEANDAMEKLWLGNNKKALKKSHKYHASQEKFYRELYEKLRSIAYG